MTCVFCGRDAWATTRHIDPERFIRISAYEVRFGKTIQHGVSVIEQASRGKSFIRPGDEEIWREALSHEYRLEIEGSYCVVRWPLYSLTDAGDEFPF